MFIKRIQQRKQRSTSHIKERIKSEQFQHSEFRFIRPRYTRTRRDTLSVVKDGQKYVSAINLNMVPETFSNYKSQLQRNEGTTGPSFKVIVSPFKTRLKKIENYSETKLNQEQLNTQKPKYSTVQSKSKPVQAFNSNERTKGSRISYIKDYLPAYNTLIKRYVLPFQRPYPFQREQMPHTLQNKLKYSKLKNQRRLLLQLTLKKNKQRAHKNLKLFKKIVRGILFIQYLKRQHSYCKLLRKHYIEHHKLQGLLNKLVNIKVQFLDNMSSFIKYCILTEHIDLEITNSQSTQQPLQQKRALINKALNIFITSIGTNLYKMFAERNIEIIYFLCRHGSYAMLEQINTLEEVNRMCINESQGYIRCDKFLQKSLIISLLFIKIIVYNILLKPKSMIYDYKKSKYSFISSNIKMIGNLLYYLMTDLQEYYIKQSSSEYKINNWKQSKINKKIIFAQSMSIKSKSLQQNQLISGLINKEIIKKIYLQDEFSKKKRLQMMVETIHQKLMKYHEKVRQNLY